MLSRRLQYVDCCALVILSLSFSYAAQQSGSSKCSGPHEPGELAIKFNNDIIMSVLMYVAGVLSWGGTYEPGGELATKWYRMRAFFL